MGIMPDFWRDFGLFDQIFTDFLHFLGKKYKILLAKRAFCPYNDLATGQTARLSQP